MFTLQKLSRRSAKNRCTLCDSKFGLIRYDCWGKPLCSRRCVSQFKALSKDDRVWLH